MNENVLYPAIFFTELRFIWRTVIIFCNELGNITTISIQNSLVYSVTFKEHIESIIIKHNYPLALAMVNS